MKLADTLRKETEERDRRLDDKVYQAVDDPTKTWVAPKRLDPVPYLNFAPLQNAVAALKKSAAAYWQGLVRGHGRRQGCRRRTSRAGSTRS